MRRILGFILLGLIGLTALRSFDAQSSNPTGGAALLRAQSQTPQPIDPRAEVRRNPERYLEISKFSWSKEGLGSFMVADFSIKNTSDYDLKDISIRCRHSAPSGTVIDSNERTIYEIIKAKTIKPIRHFSMGFVHSQAARSGCEVVGATLI
jgi:hypothetical protein